MRKTSIASNLVAALTALSACAGMLMAAFIFICGMKYMDGGGNNMQGPLIIMLPLIGLYFSSMLWSQLRKDKLSQFVDPLWVGAGSVAYICASVWAGLSMGMADVGTSIINLTPVSLWAAATAGITAVLLATHYVFWGRNSEWSS